MCLGMFMAILDIQVVATSLPAIQQALAISPDPMSWVQTAYLIAEVDRDPADRPAHARPDHALAVRRRGRRSSPLASIGCAASGGFAVLLVWRVVQGFSGGVLIPAVFSAVFLLFPRRLQAVATTIAGVVAVLAPTVGPIVGGWITETCSWHWLFLINVVPGLIVPSVTPFLLPRQDSGFRRACEARLRLSRAAGRGPRGAGDRLEGGAAARLDLAAPARSCCGKRGRPGVAFVRRSLRAAQPVVELATLQRPSSRSAAR